MYRALCLRERISQTLTRNAWFNLSRNLQCQGKERSVISHRHASSKPDVSKLVHVYSGTLSPQIKAVKVFSLSSSMMGILAQPILFEKASEAGGTPLIVAMFGFVGLFTFVTPVLLHLITRKYVMELFYDPQTENYTAVIMNFFLIKKYITFTPDDVKVPDMGGMFTTFSAKGVPLFVEPRTFQEPNHYGKIMGYDKPLDLRLKDICDKPSKEKEA